MSKRIVVIEKVPLDVLIEQLLKLQERDVEFIDVVASHSDEKEDIEEQGLGIIVQKEYMKGYFDDDDDDDELDDNDLNLLINGC